MINQADWVILELCTDSMSQLLETDKGIRKINKYSSISTRKLTFKSKENLVKPKCNKELKKKLKKYKLRRDGHDDPDVLNVSQILVNTLKIKSPNSENKLHHKDNIVDGEEIKLPSNYLFKMVRKRKTCTKIESLDITKLHTNNSNIVKDVSPELFDEETQNKKQTDAFKLMMNSRNKSIGNNSPGKEKCNNEIVAEEIFEKKEMKAKRLLSLQTMAKHKGALKNKEIEEYRDRCVEKKMLKRAEKFKDMITKPDMKMIEKEEKPSNENLTKKPVREENTSLQKVNTLKVCDLFSNTNSIIENKTLNIVSEEDIEFLNKLSPSLKKKENMLSYFPKLKKEEELTSDKSGSDCLDENNAIIKVKFNSKQKNKKVKSTKRKLSDISENKHTHREDYVIFSNSSDQISNNSESRKRKRDLKPEEKNTDLLEDNDLFKSNNERPKRNVKKPTKYTEDVHCFSSDDELHIFTPKKKKNHENTSLPKIPETVEKKSDKDICNKEISKIKNQNKIKQNIKLNHKSNNDVKQCKSTKVFKKNKKSIKINEEKKPVKLAPIFISKPQLLQVPIESKKNFLKSCVHEKLKKNDIQLTSDVTTSETFNPVVHIQQFVSHNNSFQGKDWLKICDRDNEEIFKISSNFMFKQLLALSTSDTSNFPLLRQKVDNVLKNMKNAYPKFPVYRTYHLLKGKSKGELKDINYSDFDKSIEIINEYADIDNDTPEKLSWCDKYKPSSSKQIIGNFESIKELKRWLESWTEKLIKAKKDGSDFSDMSDFYCSDTDSRDYAKNKNNVLILTGQTGSGKTNAVYAIAAELSIKVIEVNASSKRNGKIMLQDLQEATQSHKVDRGKSSEFSQRSQEVLSQDSVKKRGRQKKSKENNKTKKSSMMPIESLTPINLSQESVRTGMSLILIDDADIVFDQDDGFSSAISQLIQSSKRPVILVTSSLSCVHLQKFLHIGKVIHMHPLLPRMLGTWLDIMCLADIGVCYPGLGERILDFNKGDIRKTINYLQFIMNCNKVNQIGDIALSQIKSNFEDESSNMSWIDSESMERPTNIFHSHIEQNLQSGLPDSLDIFDVWWNLSGYFKNIDRNDNISSRKKEDLKRIMMITKLLDTTSVIDSWDHIKPNPKSNITNKPWYTNENASLLETENFEDFNQVFCTKKEISNVLMSNTISEAQKILLSENNVNIFSPSINIQRERDKIVSRHNTLSSYLNPSAVLDRRAAALDYWPSCRVLCRLEKNKPDSNVKRNNRFCHYLKSLNVLCKNDVFDSLADSLI